MRGPVTRLLILSGIAALALWSILDSRSFDRIAAAEETKVTSEGRQADRDAIRKMFAEFRAAFQRKDAAAAAVFLTNEAEIIPDEGEPLKGREAIQKAYAAYFANAANRTITINPESLRFTSRDTAIEDGHMTVAHEGESSETHRYHILFVREDGKWLVSIIKEWPAEDSELNGLGWLIGTWTAKQGDVEVQNTYEWFGDKAFIKATVSVRGKHGSFSGMQVIGPDPTTGDIHTWTFEHDGGLGHGTVVRDGPRWRFENTTVLGPEGVLETTNILVPVDRNTITWQPINLTLNGEPIGNLAPTKLTRVKK